MKPTPLFMIALLTVTASNAWAYGSSSSSKSCEKPRFGEFQPAEKSVVPAQSAFSFSAYGVADPKSIEVSVKKQPVTVSINERNGVYRVSGKLPENLQGTYARIAIRAEGRSRCQGSGGWLIEIAE